MKLSTTEIKIDISLGQNQKERVSDIMWRSLFKDLMENYRNYQHLYTDGSKQENLAGSGAWTENQQIMARLPGEVSILTCELYAIWMGIVFMKSKGKPIAVISDSLSAIKTIKSHYTSKNFLTQKIIKEVIQYNKDIIFIWVPSHVGINGNTKLQSR